MLQSYCQLCTFKCIFPFLPGCTPRCARAALACTSPRPAPEFQRERHQFHTTLRGDTSENESSHPTAQWHPKACFHHSRLMLFCSVRIHCWCKDIMVGREVVFAPEYTCIFLLSLCPGKTAGSSGTSQKPGSLSTLKQK